jgi:hypothetical protein
MREIVIDVAPDGSVKVEAKGYTGAECELATKAFEDAVGRVTERKQTMDARNVKQARVKARRG